MSGEYILATRKWGRVHVFIINGCRGQWGGRGREERRIRRRITMSACDVGVLCSIGTVYVRVAIARYMYLRGDD